jgi:hypothetical protein
MDLQAARDALDALRPSEPEQGDESLAYNVVQLQAAPRARRGRHRDDQGAGVAGGSRDGLRRRGQS